jgi:uncharacterized repeat protein (TIGR04042 family)
MPEVMLKVRWPDDTTASYYSPSTAVHAHFDAGASYALEEFLARSRAAMHAASERVRAKYGYTCSSAMDTLGEIEARAQEFGARPEAKVLVVGFG